MVFRRYCLVLPLVLTLQFSTETVHALPPADLDDQLTSHPSLFDQVQEFRLDNGMLFLLLPRTDVPIVAGAVAVKVGNVDNPAGATGLAHLFEHMAFKGTDRIGTRDPVSEQAVRDSIVVVGAALAERLKSGAAVDSVQLAELRAEIARLGKREAEFVIPMEFARVYDGYSYLFNAYTSQDLTVYTATVPANTLEAWMLMESERLQHPVFREFYAELEVVKEERRKRADDDPEEMARQLLKSLAFGEHPYRYPTIGYMEDLETLHPEQIEALWRRYYVPGNMVAALVGDFQLERAKALIEDYFGDIPPGPAPSGPRTEPPARHQQQRAVHRQGAERRLLMAFPGFAPGDPRGPVADLLASVLTRDKTSRLDRRLDLQAGVTRQIMASSTGGYQRYAGLFTITIDLLEDVTNETVEAMVWQELDRLQSDPIEQRKLDEIRASYRKGFVFGLQKNTDLVDLLATTQATQGDWRRSYQSYDDYDRVTVADITTLARDLFERENATIVYLEPEGSPSGTEGGRP